MKPMVKNFLCPKTIAVIGASEEPKKVGCVLMEKLSKFEGEVIPINPNREKVFGKKCYPSVKEFPRSINLAVIATPAITVKKILLECSEKKIESVIIISAGFSEQGNFKMEEEIKDIAERKGIRILGPNCFGVANPHLNLDITFSNSSAKKGSIAFISQSGALWSFISDISASSKIGFSGFVSLGNMADLSFNDFLEYFEKDKKTKKIILYVEKIKKGKEFIELCKKCKKPIVVVKAGNSEQGSKATMSHTGSLATDFKVYRGAFAQAHVRQENFLCSALDISGEKIKEIKLEGKETIILTNAGGAGALLSDYCEEKGLTLINIEKIGQNPLDILGTANALDYEKAIIKINKECEYDSLIIILTPQKMSEPEKTAQTIVKNCDRRKTIVYMLGEKSIESVKKELDSNAFLCFTRIKNSLGKIIMKNEK